MRHSFCGRDEIGVNRIDLTGALERGRRDALIRAGHVLVDAITRDDLRCVTAFFLSDGRFLTLTDKQLVAGGTSVVADAIRSAGALPIDALDGGREER